MKELVLGICYDFDKTLSPKDMQEFGFINKLGMTPSEFWGEVNAFRDKTSADMATGYMYYMIEKYRQKNLTFTREDLNE
ncbi:MAG: hypothetical protein KBT30_02160 [Clostridiales bacterium]|nr:hypothetical protein [Candidatus Apopatousia equi]